MFSNSPVPFSPPLNDSGVARVPIELPQNASFNTSGSQSNAVRNDNDTITFESVLLTPENMLLPQLHQIAMSNETHDAKESIAMLAMSTSARIPIEDSTAADVVSPTPFTTSPTAGMKNMTVKSSSTSSSSSAGDVSVVVGNTTTDTPPPPPPLIEAHGVPSPPTLVTAAASDGSAQVSWTTPDDDGSDPILQYEVAWLDELQGKVAGSKVVGPSQGSVGVIDTSASSQSSVTPRPNENALVPTTTTIASLTNGRSYAFKVRAKNVNGYSTWSAKSLAVSPLHPPDLCGRVACSGHGTCFPTYQATPSNYRRLEEEEEEGEEAASSDTDAHCICRPGFNPPDCSIQNDAPVFVWKVSEWGECGSGCGGGQRTRSATCWDVARDIKATNDTLCPPTTKPSLTRICNGMECGSKLVSVRYQVETSFDEVLFSPLAWDAFEMAFTTEVAAALLIPRTRLEVTAIRRGSIVVLFQILPASRVGEPSLNDIVERLQSELSNATSTLRSRGTFARRVEPTGVKLGFSIADQTVAGGAEDISIAGLIGTVFVLGLFVALFGWCLRKRHERIMRNTTNTSAGRNVLNAKRSEMKPMGIRSMA